MLKKLVSIALTIFLSLCLVTVDAATPEQTADKAVLAYAELYTYGTSENESATGLPKEISDELEKYGTVSPPGFSSRIRWGTKSVEALPDNIRTDSCIGSLSEFCTESEGSFSSKSFARVSAISLDCHRYRLPPVVFCHPCPVYLL